MIELDNYENIGFIPFPKENRYIFTLFSQDIETYSWEIKDQIYALLMGWA